MACLTDEQLGAPLGAADQAHLSSCADCAARQARAEAATASTQFAPAAPSERGTSPESSERFPDGTKIGRYVIVGVVGEGGMGKVYQAFDPELDRKVALKLLKVSMRSDPTEARARMLREAQALARLNHPNVVSIYDVGTHDDHVYLALELVDGVSLRDWIHAGGHSWRDTLALFKEAAQGLAAAHDAGLVHRDFKPLNVLIGKDGRTRVLDFGLARSAQVVEPPNDALARGATHSGPDSQSPLVSPLTREGAVSGTLGYIAPEVLRGQSADGRSDQFAFGVALFEALYGRRPWPGSTAGQAVTTMLSGASPTTPDGSRVPAWVQQVVLKAVALEPNQRFESMHALIEALSKDPRVALARWLRLAAGAALVAVAASGVIGWMRARPDCAAEQQRIGGAWDTQVSRRVQAAFVATGRPGAAETFERVARTLDDWAQAWAAEATAACRAEQNAHRDGRELIVLQRICLDRRLSELGALTSVFSSADPAVVDQATVGAHTLPSPQRCREPKLMTGVVLPIADPLLRRQSEALRTQLDQANAHFVSGQFPQAAQASRQIADVAHDAGLNDVEAGALNLLGKVQNRSYLLAESTQSLSDALAAALEGQADIEAFHAAVRSAHALDMAKHGDESERVLKIGQAMWARLGRDPLLEADLLEARASTAGSHRDFERTLQLRERVLELKRSQLGEDHPETVAAIINVSKTMVDVGQLSKSTLLLQQALTISQRTLGDADPALITAKCNLCWNYALEGRYADAAPLCEQGAELATRIHGSANTMSGWCLGDLAYARALAGDGRGAIEAGDRAVALQQKLFHDDDVEVAEARMYRARGFVAVGDLEKARTDIVAALAAATRHIDRDDPNLIEYLHTMGVVDVESGQAKEARPYLERALEVRGRSATLPEQAETRFYLARALWDSGGDRSLARALATTAADQFSAFPGHAAHRETIQRWLSEHR